jgi:hypothetical protein
MDATISDEDAKKSATTFASAQPVATAKVTDAGGTQTLEVRKAKDDYYAKSSVVEGVHKVSKELGSGLDKSLDDFRNKKLFDFGFNEPSRVEFRDGGNTSVYEKSGDKWTSAGKTMDSSTVQAFIDKIRDLQGSKLSRAIHHRASRADRGFERGQAHREGPVFAGQKWRFHCETRQRAIAVSGGRGRHSGSAHRGLGREGTTPPAAPEAPQ